MGVPTDRRIVYGVSVVPQVSYSTTGTNETMEEGYTVGVATYTDYKVDTTTNTATGESLKYLGGKSSGPDHVQVTHDQGTDEWTSMHHKDQIWENSDDIWSTTRAMWGSHVYGSTLTIAGGGAVSPIKIRDENVPIKFVYVSNIGDNKVKLSLDGNSAYPIWIPAGGSVCVRVNDSVVTDGREVLVVGSGAGNSQIEFIIAK
jgi:hypothetical protein